MLFNADVSASKDTVLYLHSIFRAIRRVEDAVDIEISPVRICSNEFIFPWPFLSNNLSTGGFFFFLLFLIPEVAHLGGHRTLFCNFSKFFWSFPDMCSKADFAAIISI